jgi:hypothetical protein
MTVEQFRAALRSQPFRPFAVHLADGRELVVQHPELALPTPSGRTAVIVQPDDTVNVVDLLLVTGLEYREFTDAA